MVAFASLRSRWLVVATVLALIAGAACNRFLDAGSCVVVADRLSLITAAFLRLIQMIIAPLVLSTLVAAVAKMGALREIGRIGGKALAWFAGASSLSLTIGLLMAHWLQPGAAVHAAATDIPAATAAVQAVGAGEFVMHLVPRSIIEAMANNEILQVVIFSLFVGTAAAALKERARHVVALAEDLAEIMFKVTDYVMRAAPLAVFAALASSVCVHGLGIVETFGKFVAGFYLSLAILWGALIAALFIAVGGRGTALLAGIRQPALLAFATASSEAAYPRLLEALMGFGISRRVAGFVLPLGYSFNLDGAMMYCTFAIMFIAQAYGIELTWGQQLSLFGMLMLTTKGVAGVPRAALAVIAVTLPHFNIPASGIALILAVDQILDMGRSATNVLGNAVAATVVAVWEGDLAIDQRADT